MIGSIKAEHKTTKTERKLAAGLALLCLQSPSYQEPESSRDTGVLLSHCRVPIIPIKTNSIYPCSVALNGASCLLFSVLLLQGGAAHACVCSLCSLLKNCHDKLQKPCQHRKEAAGPCQRESQGHKAVSRLWDCLLDSIPIFSLAGRSAHSMKHSQVLFLGLPRILRQKKTFHLSFLSCPAYPAISTTLGCRECEAGIQCGLRKNHVTSKKAESFTLGPRELLLALGKKIFSWK